MAAPGPPGGNCAERVLRGGSWAEGPDFLRPRLRLSQDATLRISHTGFRLVRELK
ncbi:MAG TPA: SUMF1/EgtB/PvdO family nonheme iron enzyme [Alphaproteobacteria bacterium]|jgi:formylglycine-generating enzyme required for sulfatase activity|nr:SUMF1/EgtB/PvdO family nonheme iron enzyme [Alphaproteobacteria bacterium]HJM49217.1 SUMF1/EgtB/PvdO family nonheme iron enzyme [Alphaproteobacteria bacterium]